MRSTTVRRLSRLVPVALTVLVAASMPSAAQAKSACAKADRTPAELGAPAVRKATLCVLNSERRAHGLRPLRQGARLARVARRHSRDMVANRYFAHDSLSGAAFSARIARAGWMRGRNGWFIGENLAWGGGSRATPRAIVKTWMGSAPHRRNVLQRRFRVVGIGVASGVPLANAGTGATYTTDFGS